MNHRKRYGQHFLKSINIAKFIVDSTNLTKNDVVYEIGTGRGILIPLLCKKSKHVISSEKDTLLYDDAVSKFSDFKNLTLVKGDGFQEKRKFDIFVSNLPYSQSKIAIHWMIMQEFPLAVIMVQSDFAEKLLGKNQKRKSISVLAQTCFDMKILRKIQKENFSPPPKINSVIMMFSRKSTISKELIQSVNLLFSFRRKKIQNIAKQLGLEIKSDMRLEDMSNNEIIKLAEKIKRI
tara:strand:+ start:3428 stop:4132 length:705 start_codon:yes stop_codon:yes gene_type:complete